MSFDIEAKGMNDTWGGFLSCLYFILFLGGRGKPFQLLYILYSYLKPASTGMCPSSSSGVLILG